MSLENELGALKLEELYVSESGSDESGDGTDKLPFKSLLRAMRYAGKEPFPKFFADSKDGEKWDLVSRSQLKKIKKIWVREQHKNVEKAAEDADRREKNLEEAKKIIITIDDSLPKPIQTKIGDCKDHRSKRVKIFGWVYRLRRHGKALMFINLRDDTGYLQCVMNDLLCQTYEALVLSTESTICVYGVLNKVPEGKYALGGHELQCDYWQLIGGDPSDCFDSDFYEESVLDVYLDLMLRDENDFGLNGPEGCQVS